MARNCPLSVRGGQRLTGMTSGQKSLAVTSSIFNFSQHGQSGAWVSELLPHTAGVADDLCIIRSMNTEAINHDPAVTYPVTKPDTSSRARLSFGSAGPAMAWEVRITTCRRSSC